MFGGFSNFMKQKTGVNFTNFFKRSDIASQW